MKGHRKLTTTQHRKLTTADYTPEELAAMETCLIHKAIEVSLKRPCIPKPAGSPRPHMTDEKRAEIRNHLRQGLTNAAVAKIVGCSTHTVWRMSKCLKP
jgi:DNA-binding NarL/FixJ family response regulator